MNNEKMNQIIGDAYKNYAWKTSMDVDGQLAKEEFINKIKTDDVFAKKWGLKIEERELSLEERFKLQMEKVLYSGPLNFEEQYIKDVCDKNNIPTKLITVTYNNETIEIYE